MTQTDSRLALERAGYTVHEADFLKVAATYGGYFLRRQYAQFLGRTVGGTSATLIDKAVANGHIRALVFAHNTVVYHLCTRSFYARIGQADNRNRRDRQPLTIKNKLMTLDFVLAHRGWRFLASDEEKVNYFTESQGVTSDALPSRTFGNLASGHTTIRYFLEKYPIGLPAGAEASTVAFCFVDEGLTTICRFQTFLDHYAALFTSLPSFQVIYVAATPRPFERAERAFDLFQRRRQIAPSSSPNIDTANRLVRHFSDRRDYESQRLESFDREKLIRYRTERAEFSGAKVDDIFSQWMAEGDAVVQQAMGIVPTPASRSNGTFSTFWIRHNYDFFGTLTTY